MLLRNRSFVQATIVFAVVFCAVLASLIPASVTIAAPHQQPPIITLELEAAGDARTQSGSPNANFGSSLHYFMTPNGHASFVQFDLPVIPANTVIQPRLGGRAEPGMPVEIVIDGRVVATITAETNGRFSHTPTPLSTDDHRFLARYPGAMNASTVNAASVDQAGFDRGYLSPYLRLSVDPSLPFDPVSLHFTDSQGRVTLPVFDRSGQAGVAGLSFDLQLRTGETYSVEVDACPGNVDVQGFRFIVGDQVVAGLTDEDEDGRYEGTFVYEAPVIAAAVGATAQSIGCVQDELSRVGA